jgi:hypothetical protein
MGPNGKAWLFARVIIIDSGAEMNAIARHLALQMGLTLRKCRVVIFGGKTSLITEMAEAVPWVFFKGTPHQIVLLVDMYVMEAADGYGVLMGQKLIMHPALSAVLRGFFPALCVSLDLGRQVYRIHLEIRLSVTIEAL